ncbi:Uncharacterized protein dnm_070390 [Desulfonema magnum]|uniref:Uncharacterized protein n=1 Tax=Desulfonema magnum TaxID=45655 RepID=A0A975GRJ1_9BACT|nr:Uncharacterized protein dnm_070390 [Desulfonema magnum]
MPSSERVAQDFFSHDEELCLMLFLEYRSFWPRKDDYKGFPKK